MLKSTGSRMAASGTFFAALAAALLGVTTPQQALADGGNCPGSGGPLCATVTLDVYCSDDQGNVWKCGETTEYYYYDKDNQG